MRFSTIAVPTAIAAALLWARTPLRADSFTDGLGSAEGDLRPQADGVARSIARSGAAAGADLAWLRRDAPCWTLLPSKQATRLQSILKTWPKAVREASASADPDFPCHLASAIAAADKAIAKHVLDNPLPISYDYDWGDRFSWPGFQTDRHYRTILQVSKELVQPTGQTHRRDCIGMQDVAFTALTSADPRGAAGVYPARLIIGNNPILGRTYNAVQYLTGGNPVDGGVHHIVGLWPVFKAGGRVRGVDGEVPEYAVILDYWITQDAADPMDLMSKDQFVTLFDGLERSGPLRLEP